MSTLRWFHIFLVTNLEDRKCEVAIPEQRIPSEV